MPYAGVSCRCGGRPAPSWCLETKRRTPASRVAWRRPRPGVVFGDEVPYAGVSCRRGSDPAPSWCLETKCRTPASRVVVAAARPVVVFGDEVPYAGVSCRRGGRPAPSWCLETKRRTPASRVAWRRPRPGVPTPCHRVRINLRSAPSRRRRDDQTRTETSTGGPILLKASSGKSH